MKWIFICLISIHGLIHLMGFLKGFGLAQIDQLTLHISKSAGLVWLLTFMLFIATALLFMIHSNLWWIFGFIAILLSQTLILFFWQDARFGTIANLILMIPCLIAYAYWNLSQSLNQELRGFLPSEPSQIVVAKESMDDLPNIVQLWLQQSNIQGNSQPEVVHLFQSGSMRLNPDGSWIPFEAEQWFTTRTPGFIWDARVGESSLINFAGRDAYIKSEGNMRIKLYGIWTLVNAKNQFIDQGVAVRYLAEMIWYPHVATSSFIQWEEMEALTIRASLNDKDIGVSGVFTFNEKGQVIRFQAERFYDKTQQLESWQIDIDPESYQTIDRAIIPTKATVTWKLASGDFTWYQVQVSNKPF